MYKGNKNVNRKLIRDKTFTTQAYSPPEAFSKHKGMFESDYDSSDVCQCIFDKCVVPVVDEI